MSANVYSTVVGHPVGAASVVHLLPSAEMAGQHIASGSCPCDPVVVVCGAGVVAVHQTEEREPMTHPEPVGDPMPVFTIKARDALAVPTIKAYLAECEEHGLEVQARYVNEALQEVVAWQSRNTEFTKLPDHPHEPVRP